jgi:hypothetical protein
MHLASVFAVIAGSRGEAGVSNRNPDVPHLIMGNLASWDN